MTLALDSVALAVPGVQQARDVYTTALAPVMADQGDSTGLDMHGSERYVLAAAETLAAEAGMAVAPSGFRGTS